MKDKSLSSGNVTGEIATDGTIARVNLDEPIIESGGGKAPQPVDSGSPASFNYATDLDDFTRAMQAAVFGPSVEGISIQGHGFNIKPVMLTDAGGNLIIDGWKGRHISHRREVVDDDQIYFKITLDKSGRGVPSIEQKVNGSLWADVVTLGIKLLVEALKEWIESRGDNSDLSTTASMLSTELGIPTIQNVEDLLTNEAIQKWVIGKAQRYLNKSWEGVANFLVVSIAYYSVLRYSVEMNKSPS